jgi:hypothetical protein
MQNKFTIQIKAAFLLVIFSLNSIMGFACSLGMDLGYNSNHHVKTTSVVVSNEEQEYDHCDFTGSNDGSNAASSGHHDCCKDEVLKFTLSDKSPVSSIKLNPPTQFALDVAAIYYLAIWNSQHVSIVHYYVQSDHPPISRDIRIAMHSFQI